MDEMGVDAKSASLFLGVMFSNRINLLQGEKKYGKKALRSVWRKIRVEKKNI